MTREFDWNAIAAGQATAPTVPDNTAAQLVAARDAAAVTALEHLRMLRFGGDDAQAFLQNQLTCDLRQVSPNTAVYGGYCTPKGRLVANFLLSQTPEAYLMFLPAALLDPVAARLRRFVLRSRVRIEPETGLHAIGLIGPDAARVLELTIGLPPRRPLEQVHYPDVTLTRLPGNAFTVRAPTGALPGLWSAMAGLALPARTGCWDWAQIHSGVAWIGPETQEQFVPQMIGLDDLGGVSFGKGCYPGQEIVARAHYLGEIKRRLHAGHCDQLAQPGDALLVAGQARGTVVNAAPAPEGGWDLLAVMPVDTGGEARLRSAEGAVVSLQVLAQTLAEPPTRG